MSSSRLSRARVALDKPPSKRDPIRASSGNTSSTAGALAAESWLRTRSVSPPAGQRWHVEISLDVIAGRPPTDYDEKTATRFDLNIYAEEWGVFFCHSGQASWIRVTDIAFVHGRDDFTLLASMPPLKDISLLLRRLERTHNLNFQRQHALVKTNIVGAEAEIRAWITTL
jgi:hypothetical protein